LLTFSSLFSIIFDQILDVMLHTVSPHRREAASPPSPRCSDAKKMLHWVTCSYISSLAVTLNLRSTLFLNGGASFSGGWWRASK
jgi:hypothetical protein